MKVLLKSGDTLVVEFEETDGCFEISQTETDIKVTVDLEDTSGRQGVIYHEEGMIKHGLIVLERSDNIIDPTDHNDPTDPDLHNNKD